MTTLRKLKNAVPLVAIAFVLVLFGSGCSETPNTAVKPFHIPNSYIIPSTLDTFNAGNIHNAELYYIFTHYDTVKYASYTNKYSQTGIDSLAAIFITDSLQTSSGSFTSPEISTMEALFDSVSNACMLAGGPTHSQLVASVGTAETNSILASDEGNFIMKADTDIRLCTSDAQIRDTISNLTTQYHSITWTPSTSHGVIAYEYLSVASHSIAFWGQPGDTIPILPPVSADAGDIANALIYAQLLEQTNPSLLNGLTPQAYAIEVGTAASQGSATNGGGGGGPSFKLIGIATLGTLVGLLLITLIFF